MTLTGFFFSRRKDKGIPGSCRALTCFHQLLAALMLSWLAAAPVAARAHQKENKKPTKAPLTSIDINRASAEELAKLPGVGSELARRIVAYRSQHGPFHRVEDLLVIRGIGPKKWRTLKPYLRLEQ